MQRGECNSHTESSLKSMLSDFLNKAYQAMDHLKWEYGENYGFIFVSNVPFRVIDKHITGEFLRNVLHALPTLDNNKIDELMRKVKITIFSDWFANQVVLW